MNERSVVPRSFVPRPSEGLNYPNLMQMFLGRVRKTPELTALRFKRDGLWRPLSWRGWELAAREIAAGLITLCGVEPGDRVALMANTRVEWALCDLAISLCGAVSVPIYATSAGPEVAFMLADSGAKVLIVERPSMLRRLHREYQEGSGPPRARGHTICIDAGDEPKTEAGDEAPTRTTLDEIREAGRSTLAGVNDAHTQIESAVAGTGHDDTFTIVYTSGTTGRPKGVILTHKNLVYEAWAIKNSIAVDRTDLQLLMLPLAHIFGRHLLWAAVESGAVTAFCGGMETAIVDMREVAPTYVGAVPRFYEKLQRKLEAELLARSRVERALADMAFDVGRRVSGCRQRGQTISPVLAAKHRLADKSVFEPIRARFGGKLRFFVSGAAPLGRGSAEYFHALGLLILEGYGLAETTGATNVNRPDRFRFGTVGPALPGCEVLVGADNEILLRGHNIMAGYYVAGSEPDTSLIDANGWLHTGDVGEVSEGFLRITDRLKDLIITAGGKNVAPQKLEGRLRAREGIGDVLVTGDRRPYLVALFSLDEAEMLEIASRERLGCRGYADLARHPRIREIVAGYVAELNESLPRYETIKNFAILPEPFSPEQVTPTQKLKRKSVEARNAGLIEGLYQASEQRT
ncbi:Long-chain-fatty-acid--CoA ligase [Enhygromyxa salina]|uniref:Long-chain-fatty-acid--CoA ligase n=1 Tax=Enhygromyxa salina TaxID=215803 RepID=A0A0C1ZMM9_9BACT|nr:long-chain fatty acid--CoA ligase [Enhygromyxa salina]KIG12288.1 Long-chain-fatty-acid--CoA ligase [Enhygromyxa salina]